MKNRKTTRWVSSFLVLCLCYCLTPLSAVDAASFRYSDDGSSSTWNWAKRSIYWAYDNGLMTGRSNRVFDADGKATRAEAAVVLVRYNDIDPENYATKPCPFQDSSNGWYTKYITAAADNKLVEGTKTGYEPSRSITRAEAVALILRTMGDRVSLDYWYAFEDVQDAWYEPYIQTAYHLGYISGRSSERFAPNAPITRGEFAQMLYRANSVKKDRISASALDAQKQFAAVTAAELIDSEKNYCYSPLSLYEALSIAADGATDNTLKQMLQVLGIKDTAQLQKELAKQRRHNERKSEAEIIHMANSLWPSTAFPIKESWTDHIQSSYDAEVFPSDYTDPSKVSKKMGKWISDNTGGMLEPSIDVSDTVLAIINTVWYKGIWNQVFYPEFTSKDTFTDCSGKKQSVDFMHTTDSGSTYFKGNGYTIASRSMGHGKMTFVLPDDHTDCSTLLTEQKWAEILSAEESEKADVVWSIPKFEITSSYPLIDTLKTLGITDAFSETDASFQNISSLPIWISSIIQEAKIRVDEEGTEAAAYSYIDFAGSAAMIEKPKEIITNLNRPFLYYLSLDDGSILFMGVVNHID